MKIVQAPGGCLPGYLSKINDKGTTVEGAAFGSGPGAARDKNDGAARYALPRARCHNLVAACQPSRMTRWNDKLPEWTASQGENGGFF
jgi:hypothetical protein